MKRKPLALTLILALVFSVAGPYYVKPVMAKTITVPNDYFTIQGAINAAKSGDTVFVKNGIYSEKLVINKPLSIIGENPARTIINGTGNIVTINAPEVVINGFTIGTPKYLQEVWKWGITYIWARGMFGVHVNNTSNCNITNNRIVNTYCGIYLSSASNNNLISNLIINVEIGINLLTSVDSVVSGNQIVRSTRAIILQRSSYNQIIENTLINQTDGIVLHGEQEGNYGHSTYNLIRANNISNSQDYGIRLNDSPNNRVLENRIWNNYGTGIHLGISSSNLVVSNLIYNFAPNSGYWGMSIHDSNDNRISANYIINPFIVDEGNHFTGGISTYNISNTQIIGNKIENNRNGIVLTYPSANNTLYANQIENTTNPYIIGDDNGSQNYQNYQFTSPDNMSIPQITGNIPQLSTMPNIEIPEVEIPSSTPQPSSPTPTQPNPEFPTWLVLVPIIIAILLIMLVFLKKRKHAEMKRTI